VRKKIDLRILPVARELPYISDTRVGGKPFGLTTELTRPVLLVLLLNAWPF